MNTINSIPQSKMAQILGTPNDGDFDQVAKLATGVLNVPFVLISLNDFDKTNSDSSAHLNGNSNGTESRKTISVSSPAYLPKELFRQHPDEIKKALAESDDLNFYATAPLVSESGEHLGSLYAFDRDSKLWGNVHWEILEVIAGIIIGQLEVKLAAQQVIQAQQDMALMMTHDIRGAVCNIPVLVKMIRDENENPEKQKALGNMIVKAAENGLQTVDQFYANSRIFSREEPTEKSEFNFSDLTRKTANAHRPFAAQKHLHINMLIEPNIRMKGCEKSMSKLIDNLLSNAIKYSFEEQTVDVILVKSKDFIILEVRDEGVGMSRSDINNAFKRFGTLSAKPTNGEDSTGLGLWIIHEIARQHHGKVTLKSRGKDKGTAFTVMLPKVQDQKKLQQSMLKNGHRSQSNGYNKNGFRFPKEQFNSHISN